MRIIEIYRYLSEEKHEYVISKQLLRSGTSIGANVEEALAGSSRKDFAHKMSLASKEARETVYWIRLLIDSNYLSGKQVNESLSEAQELVNILTAIVKTTVN